MAERISETSVTSLTPTRGNNARAELTSVANNSENLKSEVTRNGGSAAQEPEEVVTVPQQMCISVTCSRVATCRHVVKLFKPENGKRKFHEMVVTSSAGYFATGSNLEGSGCDVTDVVSLNVPGGTEEYHNKLQ